MARNLMYPILMSRAKNHLNRGEYRLLHRAAARHGIHARMWEELVADWGFRGHGHTV